jgi:hypothetical protein
VAGAAASIFIGNIAAAQCAGYSAGVMLAARAYTMLGNAVGVVQSGVAYYNAIQGTGSFGLSDAMGFLPVLGFAARKAGLPGKACFAAGTPLLTPAGSRPIERIEVGDDVLARPEDASAGDIRPRRVLQTFVREARIHELRVGGRLIETTAEHPFFVPDRGWTPAGSLQPGDRLLLAGGGTLPVESLTPADRWRTVYNVEVEADHTYFVGDDEWGFAVWAHNAVCISAKASEYGADDLSGEALRARRAGEVSRKHNLLVVEYQDEGGAIQHKLLKNLPGRSDGHSEAVMDRYLSKKGISPENVRRIYTEYYPCDRKFAGCRALLGKFTNAEVTWSFTFDHPGGRLTEYGRVFRRWTFDRLGIPRQ